MLRQQEISSVKHFDFQRFASRMLTYVIRKSVARRFDGLGLAPFWFDDGAVWL